MTPTVRLNNGVFIPTVGYGVWMITDHIVDCVESALAYGYRHIDTASAYKNEAGIGKAIAESGIPRKEIFITTKLSNDDMRQNRAREALEESLERLGLDYIDLYLTHWPVKDAYIDAYCEIEKLYERGFIRSIGVSNCLEHHLNDLLESCGITPAVNQVQLHPEWTQQSLLNVCALKGIAVEAYSPLGHGNLLPQPLLAKIAEGHGKSQAQVVLRWHLQRGVIVLPKSTHTERIRENIALFDFELSSEEMAQISGMNRDQCYIAHPDSFDF